MTEKPSIPARRSYRRRPITVTEPTILPMPEEDRPEAVEALARWLAELLNDDDFRAKVDDHTRKSQGGDST